MAPRPAADTPPAAEGRVHMVVALRAEARPIIEHLRLSPVARSAPFRVFLSADKRLALAIWEHIRDDILNEDQARRMEQLRR